VRATLILPVVLLSTACSTPPSTDGGGNDATVDVHSNDARADAPATDAPTSDTVMPSCGSDAWVTYGHDARRTFATDACIQGPLTMGWRYDPAPASGQTLRGVFHAIADSRGAYLQWRASRDPYLGTTAIDLVSTTGMRTWTFDTGTDSNLGNWASLWMGTVLVNDDGIYMLDAASGMRVRDTGVDWWGQTAPDPARLYVVNAAHIDGPGLFVGAVDMMLQPAWQANQYGMCRIDATDLNGAIAVDGGTLFYAPKYTTGMGVHLPFDTGVYAFDGAAGTMRWSQTTTPSSTVSAGDGHVYLVENANTLVARNQSDGRVAWMATVMGAGTQAPVLAAGRVIVAGSAGVMAFDAATGMPAWTAAMISASEPPTTTSFTGGCAGLVSVGGPILTSMAAALGSNTLIVTARDGVHVLSLTDGTDRWHGAIAGAMGAVHDPVPIGNVVYVTDSMGLMALRSM
jgi:hypothetical protein